MLAGEAGRPARGRRPGRGLAVRQQEPDGSWFGRWGVNYVYGTGAAVPALVAAGVAPDDRRIRRAVTWLERAPERRRRLGRGPALLRRRPSGGAGAQSTASQTAWALLALLAAGERDQPAYPAGASTGWSPPRRDDGTWDEPWFTGTGFPWDFSINYHLYRLVWPVMALGRYVAQAGGVPP